MCQQYDHWGTWGSYGVSSFQHGWATGIPWCGSFLFKRFHLEDNWRTVLAFTFRALALAVWKRSMKHPKSTSQDHSRSRLRSRFNLGAPPPKPRAEFFMLPVRVSRQQFWAKAGTSYVFFWDMAKFALMTRASNYIQDSDE